MKEVESILHKETQKAQGSEAVRSLVKDEKKFSKMLSDAAVQLEVLKRKLDIEKILTALAIVDKEIDKYRTLYNNAKERVDNLIGLNKE